MARQITNQDPHGEARVVLAGTPLDRASGALIAVHGRGADAEDIVALAREIAPEGIAIVAPQAAGNTWYPHRFMEPIERNEPYLSSALKRIGDLVDDLSEAGISPDRIAVMGFSQGACLVLEAVARNARRYAGVIGFSGGLIGPPGTRFAYPGSLAGTPVFLGCSDIDSHIPETRVRESAAALELLGGNVEARIYPGMGHTVNRDELEAARTLLGNALASPEVR